MKWIDILIAVMVILLTSAAIFQDAQAWLLFLAVMCGILAVVEELADQWFDAEQRRKMPVKDHFDGVYHKNSKDLEC